MNPFSKVLAAGLASTTLSLPTLAHVASAEAPHLHGGDGWGVLAVALLTALSAWLGRRRR